MAKNIHLERIGDTEANVQANLDALQLAILTDQDQELTYENYDATRLYYTASQWYYDGSVNYLDVDFSEITAHDDILVAEYIKRAAGTDDYVRFENDKISIAAGGTTAWIFEDDKSYTDLNTGIGVSPNAANKLEVAGNVRIGDAGAAAFQLEVRKDQDVGTVVSVKNTNNHAGAYALFEATSNLAAGYMGAFSTLYGESEFLDKLVLKSNKKLAFFAVDDEVQFYVGGLAAGNKVATFTTTGLGIGVVPNAANKLEVAGNVRIGDAGAAAAPLEVTKNHDATTLIKCINTNNHANSQASYYTESTVASGVFGSYPVLSSAVEYRDKTICYSSKDLALFGIDNEIQIYVGGSAAGNKVATFNSTGLGIGTSTPLVNVGTAAGDFDGFGLHIKNTASPNGSVFGRLILEGASGGSIVQCNSEGAANDKMIEMITAGGTTEFRSLNDDATERVGNILAMDLGTGDIFSEAWTDYSGSSTVVGFSGTPTKSIFYKRIGKLVFVNYILSGISNSTDLSFTLPISCTGQTYNLTGCGMDNGSNIAGGISGQMNFVNSTTITLQANQNHGIDSTSWTNSGNKRVRGQFWYEAA